MPRARLFKAQCHLGKLFFYILTDVLTDARRLLRSARWRQTPATESQKQLLSKRWLKHDAFQDPTANDAKTKRIASMTKGEVANILTRLKHGAQVIALSSFSLSNYY